MIKLLINNINTETPIIDSDSSSFQRFPNDPALILPTNSNEYFANLASFVEGFLFSF